MPIEHLQLYTKSRCILKVMNNGQVLAKAITNENSLTAKIMSTVDSFM